MKAADVQIGKTYRVKVSGRMAPVTVIRTRDQATSKGYRQVWECRNELTGRSVLVRSAQRFRHAVVDIADDDANVLRYAGGMGHTFIVTIDNREGGRRVYAECGDPDSARRMADESLGRNARIYRKVSATQWKLFAKPTPPPAPTFNESDCGGAFDGVTVTSDADPGL